MTHLDRTATAAVLADAMEAGTTGITAPPDLAQHVLARRRRHDRLAVGAVAAAVFGTVVATAVVVVGGLTPRPARPARPAAASATPSATPSESAATGRHSQFDVTALPAGYRFAHGTTDPFLDPANPQAVSERVSFQRGDRALITLETLTGSDHAMTRADLADQEGVEVVQLAGRTMFHFDTGSDRNGLNVYEWTEEVGLDVVVDGRGGATDAELRAFIAGLRRRGTAATSQP
ncbi:MAG TPA: hypothetical protein VFQ85_12910 [Mycobacteriales bacterium]|nr:hypothetical protein [Mycobacteriales bacterium]